MPRYRGIVTRSKPFIIRLPDIYTLHKYIVNKYYFLQKIESLEKGGDDVSEFHLE
jgi:hypothetical protein